MKKTCSEIESGLDIPVIPELSEEIGQWGVPYSEKATFVLVIASKITGLKEDFAGPVAFFDNELAARRVTKKAEKVLRGVAKLAYTEFADHNEKNLVFNVGNFFKNTRETDAKLGT